MAEDIVRTKIEGDKSWRDMIGTEPEPESATDPKVEQEQETVETAPVTETVKDSVPEEKGADQVVSELEKEARKADHAPSTERKQETVPLSTFTETKHQLRELRAEIQRMKEERQREAQAVAARSKEIALPDPEQDPEGYQRAVEARNSQRIEQIEGMVRNEQTKRQSDVQKQDLKAKYNRDFFAYADTNPDAVAAHNHVMQKRREVLAERVPENRIDAVLHDEDLAMAQVAYRLNMNPGAFKYGLAIAQGFIPGGVSSNGAVTDAVPDKQDAVEKLDRIAKGQKASGKSAAGVSSADRPLTPEDALAMGDTDKFREWFNTKFRKEGRASVGRG